MRRRRLVEARLVRERGVAVREIDQAALLAALRHDDPHPAAGALRQPGLERLALVRLGRHVNLGRRAAQLVELLQRRLEHVAFARRRRSPSSVPSSTRSTTRPLRTWKTWTTAPAGPELEAEHVAMAELGRRHLLLAVVQRLHRAQRVAQLRRLLEPLAVGRVEHPRRCSVFDQLVVPPFEEQLRRARPRAPYSSAEQIVVDARRDAALDVVLEAGPAALAGDHLVARPDAEQPVRQRHRLAREAAPA